MKFLSYGVMTYMLLALIWWTVLLSKNNNEIYKKNIELTQLNARIDNLPKVYLDIKSDQIHLHHERIRQMIIGEGLVFGLSLILGMWMVQNAFNKEIEQTRNQKNFLLSITHEFKSPIAAIQLITETLLKRRIEKEQQEDLYHSILSENKRLELLINNLLLAARLDNSYQFNFERLDINSIIKKCIDHQTITNPESIIHFNGEQPVYISGDRTAIVSVFTNLIENGIKYGSARPLIQISQFIIDKHLHIAIKDNGTGIPDKEKGKVFNQFYRMGNEETRKTKGTGLGLYITNKFVKAHNGKIIIEDNPDGGTIFNVILPLI